jgi:protease-4
MKKYVLSAFILTFFLSACAPQIHLDFLGTTDIKEVVLVPNQSEEKILLLDISGIIATTLNPGLFDREGDMLSQVFYRLQKATEDKTVKGVILRLDTTGGEVTASNILYNEIRKFKEKTGLPFIALMMSVAASGGYYIASACDFIIAHPSTITGSIGVISIFPNVDELFAKLGVKVHVIKSGAMKDAGSSFREMTKEEEQIFQGIIDEFYMDFLEVVHKARQDHLSMEELIDIADGRVYTAKQALDLNLIDKIGYFDTAVDKVLDLAQIEEAQVVSYTYYPKSKTNIYAAGPKPAPLLEGKNLQDLLPSLKSGFYYLWLPVLDYLPR